MSTTTRLRTRTSIGQYPRPPQVTVEQYAAQRLGVTEGTVHQWMYGENRLDERVAAIVEGFVQTGQEERADRWLVPIITARAGFLPRLLTDDLIVKAQDADLDEDHAENEFRARRTRDAAVRWVKKAEAQLSQNLALISAIKTEFEL